MMDRLFDFNGDGRRSFSEEMFGLGLINMILHESEQEESAQQTELDAAKEKADSDA